MNIQLFLRFVIIPLSVFILFISCSKKDNGFIPRNADPSLYAGLKAMITCSAFFISERNIEDILQDELGDMVPEAASVPDPVIDSSLKVVSVSYSPDKFPRLAVYREGIGCTILPPGSSHEDAASLPKIKLSVQPGDFSNRQWPKGDLVPEIELPERINVSALEAVVSAAFDTKTYGKNTKTIGVAIVVDGQLIAERYRTGFNEHTQFRTWSVAKSITNALIGILVKDGMLDILKPAPIPEWRTPGDPRGQITLENLLHMSSGLQKTGSKCYDIYFNGANAVDSITSAQLEVSPGTRWYYSNRDTLLLVSTIRTVLGNDEAYHTFPWKALFNKIGMHDTILEMDIDGNFILSSQVYSTARDLARFGLLYLNDGIWCGERILPEGWVSYTVSPAPARATGLKAFFEYGLAAFVGYGAQFWLFNNIPFFPSDVFTAIGHRGQYVTIAPSSNMVVVRTGLDADDGSVTFRQDRFVRDLIKAVSN